MTDIDPDEHARALADESLAAGDPTGWFERLYAASETGAAVVPWDRGRPNPALVAWAERRALDGDGGRAVVVGSGLGDDAEYVASRGYATTAFDVSASATRAARRRFPGSRVEYVTADLLALPDAWRGAFDLVVESITVQALPVAVRRHAIAAVGSLVAPGGTLLVIAAAREPSDGTVDGPPWPLLRGEVESFASGTLRAVRIEGLGEPSSPHPVRWRAEFTRSAAGPVDDPT